MFSFSVNKAGLSDDDNCKGSCTCSAMQKVGAPYHHFAAVVESGSQYDASLMDDSSIAELVSIGRRCSSVILILNARRINKSLTTKLDSVQHWLLHKRQASSTKGKENEGSNQIGSLCRGLTM